MPTYAWIIGGIVAVLIVVFIFYSVSADGSENFPSTTSLSYYSEEEPVKQNIIEEQTPQQEAWKTRVDELLLKQQQEKERIERERIEAEEREKALREAENQRQYAEQLRVHQQKFKCSISTCGKPSSGPWSGTVGGYTTYSYSSSDSPKRMSAGGTYMTDWDKPTGLSQCSNCQQWVCYEHIHRGICPRHV